jgi:prepilin-type processing-associated H-X9-DG protein
MFLQIYQNENDGWLYPVGNHPLTGSPYASYGINVPPHERWPVKVFKLHGAPEPPPYDATLYTQYPYQPDVYPAAPYTPPIMLCPSDLEPAEAHSYVLNSHLAERSIRAGSRDFGGLTVSEVIVAGEKYSSERDYYMQNLDYGRVVEQYRHGATLGSNYLYLDCHVGTVLPRDALAGLDPWDLRGRAN